MCNNSQSELAVIFNVKVNIKEKQRGKRAHIYTREKEQEEKFTSLYSKTTFYAIQFWLAKQHGECHTCFHKDLILESRGGAGICFEKFVFI